MPYILCATLCCGLVFSHAQQVPKHLEIGSLKLHINEASRKELQKEVDRLTVNPKYYQILVDRMNLYFPLMESEFNALGVPTEIMYLSIQESGLISDAVSSANAVGFWQFKDFTAKGMGLTINRLVDERLHIQLASKGAAKYLKQHNVFYDNWIYAILAYQTGRGGAEKHVRSENFGAKKMTITPKTYWYVKKFIAHWVAFSPKRNQAHSQNLWLDKITNTKGKTLNQIAKANKLDVSELKQYNKWLKTTAIPNNKDYSVFVPKIGNRPKVLVAEATNTDKPKTATISEVKYPSQILPVSLAKKVQTQLKINNLPVVLATAQDNISSLANKGGITTKKFKKYNDISLNDNKIKVNAFYYIKKKKSKSKIPYHITLEGQSLWEVSQTYGIQLKKLVIKNNLQPSSKIKKGRILYLKKQQPDDAIKYYNYPSVKNTSTSKVDKISTMLQEIPSKLSELKEKLVATGELINLNQGSNKSELQPIFHVVQKGESLLSIAKKYDMSVSNLMDWNSLNNPNTIQVGQKIKLKSPFSSEKSKIKKTHVVQSGDTLFGIAKKYNITLQKLMRLNNLSNANISVGRVLRLK